MRAKRRPDPRTLSTAERIRGAAAEALRVKGKLPSVGELAAHAHVSRGTFYLHYRTTDDVIRELEEAAANDVRSLLGDLPTDEARSFPAAARRIAEYFAEKSVPRLLLARPNGNLRGAVSSALAERYLAAYPDDAADPLLRAHFECAVDGVADALCRKSPPAPETLAVMLETAIPAARDALTAKIAELAEIARAKELEAERQAAETENEKIKN